MEWKETNINEQNIEKEAREETQEYIYHIGERIHKLQILAQKCYDVVKEFNEEIDDFAATYPDLVAINYNLRLKIISTTPEDKDLDKHPRLL